MSKVGAMSSGGNIIVLSPHLDDAALCVGGLLERLSCMSLQRHVEVVNIFTASIYVREGFELSPKGITVVLPRKTNI